MTGFTRALGVRCSHCHVGEEGKPLSTYDFASDDNPNKNRAREMLRMLGSVNDHLKKIEPSGEQRINMWCHTCHRGRPRPMTLGEELNETYRTRGLDAALAHLADLKERFYGKGAYDFTSERTLNTLGYAALTHDDAAGAIKIFEMNAERQRPARRCGRCARGALRRRQQRRDRDARRPHRTARGVARGAGGPGGHAG